MMFHFNPPGNRSMLNKVLQFGTELTRWVGGKHPIFQSLAACLPAKQNHLFSGITVLSDFHFLACRLHTVSTADH